MPAGTIAGHGRHDPFGPAAGRHPDQRHDHASTPRPAMIDVDLTDNIDCVPAGVNESRTCAMNNVHDRGLQLDRPRHPAQRRHLPPHQGAAARELRRRHPALSALLLGGDDERRRAAGRDDPAGDSPTPGTATGWPRARAASAPASPSSPGTDWRKGDEPYVNQKFLGSQGGPAGPEIDGWVTYGNAGHQRPDVPRQRRDRRAEVPDPGRARSGSVPTRRAPAAGAARPACGSPTARSTIR